MGAELTDCRPPYGLPKRGDVAEVVPLTTAPGPVRLFPAPAVEPEAAIAGFGAMHPQGADYVIVPAMSRDDDPVVIAWLRRQAEKGAVIIGVCAGAKVVAAARLLDGKRATTHWPYLRRMQKRAPTSDHGPDRRMVADRGVAAGITMMPILIEAIAGRDRAEAVARDLGTARWDVRHASGAFRLTRPVLTRPVLTRPVAAAVWGNRLAFWKREELRIALTPGMDAVSLALVADGWSRTWRSQVPRPASSGAAETRSGIRGSPDRQGAAGPGDRRVTTFPDRKPAGALDRTPEAIIARYGARTTDIVAMQLEYPR